MPVDVTVDFNGRRSLITFDVMPSYEQLRYCIRHDIVCRGSFEMHSNTMRGTPVVLKDQHALNRVSSDGSNFCVRVIETAAGARAASPPHASGEKKKTSPTRAASPHSAAGVAAAASQRSDPSARSSVSTSPIRPSEGSRSPARTGGKLFAPTTAVGAWGGVGSAIAANLVKAIPTSPPSSFAFSPSSTIGTLNDSIVDPPPHAQTDRTKGLNKSPNQNSVVSSSPTKRALSASSSPRHRGGVEPEGLQQQQRALSGHLSRTTPAAAATTRNTDRDEPTHNTESAQQGSLDIRLLEVLPVNEVITAAEVVDTHTVWHSEGSSPTILIRDTTSGDLLRRVSTSAVSSTNHCCSALLAVGVDTVWAGFTDGTVVVFHTESLKEIAVLRGHRGCVTDLCLSTSGTFTFSSSEDGTLRQYDAAFVTLHNILDFDEDTSSRVRGSSAHGGVTSVLCVAAVDVPYRRGTERASMTWAFCGTSSRSIHVWIADQNRIAVEVCDAHQGSVTTVEVEPLSSTALDRVRLWSGSSDGRVRIWNTILDKHLLEPTMHYVAEFHAHRAPVVKLKRLESRVLTLSEDHTLAVYSTTCSSDTLPQLIAKMHNGSRATPYSCMVVTKSALLRSVWLCGGLDRTISVWQVPDELSSSKFVSSVAGQLYAEGGRAAALEDAGSPRHRMVEGWSSSSAPGQGSRSASTVHHHGSSGQDSDLVLHMRMRLAQRQLVDCVSEEMQFRRCVELEHERDLFRLLSLHDTIVRSVFSVTKDEALKDHEVIILLSHAHLGVTYLSLYDSFIQNTIDVMRSLRLVQREGEDKTQRLMTGIRSLQSEMETQVKSLQGANGEQHEQYQALKGKFESVLARNELLELDISDLTTAKLERDREIEHLEQRVRDHTMRTEMLENQYTALLNDSRTTIARLEERATVAEREAESKIAALQKHRVSHDDSVHELEKAYRQAKLEIVSLQQQVEAQEQRMAARDKNSAQQEERLSVQLNEERHKYSELSGRCEDEIALLKQQHQEKISELQQQHQTLELRFKEQQRLMDEVATAAAQAGKQQQHIEVQHRADMQALQQALTEAKRTKETEVAMLENLLRERNTQCEQRSQQLQSMEQVVAASRSAPQKFKEQYDLIIKERDTLTAQLKALSEAAEVSNKQYPAMLMKLKGDIVSLEGSLAMERTRRGDTEQLLFAAEEHYEVARRQFAEETMRLTETAEREQQRLQSEIKDMKVQLTACNSELLSTKSELASARQIIEECRTTVEQSVSIAKEKELLERELEEERRHVECLSEDLKALDIATKCEADQAVLRTQSQQQAVRQQLAAKCEALHVAECRARDLEADLATLQMQLRTAEERYVTVEVSLKHDMASHQLAQDAAAQQIAQAHESLRALRQEQYDAQQSHLKQCRDLEHALHVATRKYEDAQSTLEALQRDHACRHENQDAERLGLEASLQALRSKHEAYVQESETEQEALRRNVDIAHRDLESVRLELQGLGRELAAANQRIDALHNALGEAQRNVRDLELQLLAGDKAHGEVLEAVRAALLESQISAQRAIQEAQERTAELSIRDEALASWEEKLHRAQALHDEQVGLLKEELEQQHQEALLLHDMLKAKQLEVDHMLEKDSNTIQLLQDAQHALQKAADPSPASSVPSSPRVPLSPLQSPRQQQTLAERKASVAALRQVVLIQSQRDVLLHWIDDIYMPYFLARTNLFVDFATEHYQHASTAAATAAAVLVQLETKSQAHTAPPATSEPAQIGTVSAEQKISALASQNAKLVEAANQRNALIEEVQSEMQTLYAKYRSEVQEHQTTKKRLASDNQHFSQLVDKLRGQVMALEQQMQRLQSSSSQRSAGNDSRSLGSSSLNACKEGVEELLEGIRDAVDLLQPMSLNPPSLPTEATLQALYEWMISAQLRCEVIALTLQ